MRHGKFLTIGALLGSLALTGCGTEAASSTSLSVSASQPSESSSKAQQVPEQSLTDDIPDDNYRNYYEIFVGSYADSNGDGIGDLKGIQSKLNLIRKMGFTGIWLTPIFSSPSYHKYNASDYFTVDKSFGTNDDLKALVAACHEKGIKIILDLVLNHSSRTNPWFMESALEYAKKIKGEKYDESLADRYVFYPDQASANAAKRMRVSSYSTAEGTVWYECNFDDDMPEFNFDADSAWTAFQSVIDRYETDYGVDGFRLDAVKYYYLNDTAKNVTALSKVEALAKAKNPKAYVVGECWDSQDIIADYYHSDLDSYFWFPGQGANGFVNQSQLRQGKANATFAKGEQAMEASAKDHIPAPFLDNHDTPRISGSYEPSNKFTYGLLSTLSGNAFTYYGTELGINSYPGGDQNYRTHMAWGDGTDCQDPNNGQADYPFGTMADQLADSKGLVSYVSKANAIRNAYPIVARGKTVSYQSDETVLSLQKTDGDKTMTIVYNFSSEEAADYDLDGKTVVSSLLAGRDDVLTKAADGSLILPPLSVVYLNEGQKR